MQKPKFSFKCNILYICAYQRNSLHTTPMNHTVAGAVWTIALILVSYNVAINCGI